MRPPSSHSHLRKVPSASKTFSRTPASTRFEIVARVDGAVETVFTQRIRIAAQGDAVDKDDATMGGKSDLQERPGGIPRGIGSVEGSGLQ